ncbi:hypothetical protein MIR68_010260 [Amoeboaphelidium protococcarum]|nr:hypothetical protein MIR68_010260 [Amoeboaphelidium protococcarum]
MNKAVLKQQAMSKSQYIQRIETSSAADLETLTAAKQAAVSDDNKQNIAADIPLRGSMWMSAKNCTYPQTVGIYLVSQVNVKQIILLCHHYMIPSKVELRIGDSMQNLQHLGHVTFNDNERNSYALRELKSIDINAVGQVIQLVLHRPYENGRKLNNAEQVAFMDMELVCEQSGTQNVGVDKDSTDGQQRAQEWQSWRQALLEHKQALLKEENYAEAKFCKHISDKLDEYLVSVKTLTDLKRRAVAEEDFDKADRYRIDLEQMRVMFTKWINSQPYQLVNQRIERVNKNEVSVETQQLQQNAGTSGQREVTETLPHVTPSPPVNNDNIIASDNVQVNQQAVSEIKVAVKAKKLQKKPTIIKKTAKQAVGSVENEISAQSRQLDHQAGSNTIKPMIVVPFELSPLTFNQLPKMSANYHELVKIFGEVFTQSILSSSKEHVIYCLNIISEQLEKWLITNASNALLILNSILIVVVHLLNIGRDPEVVMACMQIVERIVQIDSPSVGVQYSGVVLPVVRYIQVDQYEDMVHRLMRLTATRVDQMELLHQKLTNKGPNDAKYSSQYLCGIQYFLEMATMEGSNLLLKDLLILEIVKNQISSRDSSVVSTCQQICLQLFKFLTQRQNLSYSEAEARILDSLKDIDPSLQRQIKDELTEARIMHTIQNTLQDTKLNPQDAAMSKSKSLRKSQIQFADGSVDKNYHVSEHQQPPLAVEIPLSPQKSEYFTPSESPAAPKIRAQESQQVVNNEQVDVPPIEQSAKVQFNPSVNSNQKPESLKSDVKKHHTCIFCEQTSERFNEKYLDYHYQKECTMLTSCRYCNMIVEIQSLDQHYKLDCSEGHLEQCPKCMLYMDTPRMKVHQRVKKCKIAKFGDVKCYLCGQVIGLVSNREDAFYKHLMVEGCPKADRQPPQSPGNSQYAPKRTKSFVQRLFGKKGVNKR